MKILELNNFNIQAKPHYSPKYAPLTNFGLKMKQPLGADTVSFKGIEQTVKKMSNRSDGCSIMVAKQVRARMAGNHKTVLTLFNKRFKDILSTDTEKKLITLKQRLKSENSICEKTATRGWVSKDEILKNMGDISGLCLVLESPKSLKEAFKGISDMVKAREVVIDEVEYLRRPPVYQKGEIVESFESLNQEQVQNFTQALTKFDQNLDRKIQDVNSMTGYSAMHISLLHKDGTKTEVKLMTRGMHDLHEVENLYYKAKNGKDINPKYKFIKGHLEKLKVLDPKNLTPEELKIHKPLFEYTQAAYAEALRHPYDSSKRFLSTTDPAISEFDFNKTQLLMDACNRVAKI